MLLVDKAFDIMYSRVMYLIIRVDSDNTCRSILHSTSALIVSLSLLGLYTVSDMTERVKPQYFLGLRPFTKFLIKELRVFFHICLRFLEANKINFVLILRED